MNVSATTMPYRRQRGVSTLAITMLLLIIISLVVLFSTSVGFFEQRTATNENRARIAEQAAEAGINLAGEALKANRDKVISNITGGWLDSTANNAGWKTCAGVSDTATIDGRPHPCRSEADSTRRAQLWFYTTDGAGASTAATRFIPSTSIGNVGGAAAFPSVVDVQAVLCRIDSSLATPACASSPAKGNRIAVTFIATATLTNENTTAVIKETWASYTDASRSRGVGSQRSSASRKQTTSASVAARPGSVCRPFSSRNLRASPVPSNGFRKNWPNPGLPSRSWRGSCSNCRKPNAGSWHGSCTMNSVKP